MIYMDLVPTTQNHHAGLSDDGQKLSGGFIDAAIQNFKKPCLRDFGFEPVGSAVVVASDIRVYRVTSQYTSLIHVVEYVITDRCRIVQLLGHVKHHQGMYFGKADLKVKVTVNGHDRGVILCDNIQ